MKKWTLTLALVLSLSACGEQAVTPVAINEAPDDLVRFHTLKDETYAAYRDKNYDVALEKAEAALGLRPNHSLNALYVRIAEALGDEARKDIGLARLEAQGLNILRPLKEDIAVGAADVVIERDDRGRLPESMVVTGLGPIVGYVTDRKIVFPYKEVDVSEHGSPLGLNVNWDNGDILVSTGLLPQSALAEGETERTSARVFSIDPLSHRIREPSTIDEEGVVFGSVAASNGRIFASDSFSARLFIEKDKKMVPIAGHDGFGSFQGIATFGAKTYVADYSNGIYYYNSYNKEQRYMGNQTPYSLSAIDGLAAYGQNMLIGVQNGLWPHRVLAMKHKDGTITCVNVLASNLPEFEEPTSIYVRHDMLYVLANSQWPRFGDADNLPVEAGDPVKILAYDLTNWEWSC